MPGKDSEILQALEQRAKRKSSAKIYDGGHRGWVPNPDRVENPGTSGGLRISHFLDAFTPVRIVDLHSLEPEDLVIFRVSVVSYLLKIEEGEHITAWVRTASGGLTAPMDNLGTVALARTRKKELDKYYPGALIVNGVHRMRTRIAMPYFSFDRSSPDRVKTPRNAWIDSVREIWVKRSRD